MNHATCFHVIALGCKVSQYEAQGLATFLEGRLGLQPARDAADADLVLVHTCTVTSQSDREARRLVRRYKRKPGTRVIVTGCYAERDPEALYRAGADLVLGHRTPDRARRIANFIGMAPDRVTREDDRFPPPSLADQRTRAFLKVQDGCDVHCTFCIVPTVRGTSRSLPPQRVLARIRDLVARHGVKEIVLTGVNLAAYGRDLAPPVGLATLLTQIAELPGAFRIRISSLGAFDLDPDLFPWLLTHPRFAPHVHLPLQSASPQILARMQRPYTLEQFQRILEVINGLGPHICVGTDLMVGFPGETEADFEQTCRFLEESRIDYAHVFPYSPRPGTQAAQQESVLSAAQVRDRAARLREIVRRKREAFYRRQIGTRVLALTLHRTGPDHMRALSGNYLDLVLPDPEKRLQENQWVEVELGDFHNGHFEIRRVIRSQGPGEKPSQSREPETLTRAAEVRPVGG